MDSGIKLAPETVKDIEELEAKKLAFMIMNIGKKEGARHETVNVIQKVYKEEAEEEFAAAKEAGAKIEDGEHAAWYAFRTNLMKHDIAFGAGFLEYKSKDGCERTKLVYVYFNRNDSAPMKQAMVYSSTKVYTKIPSMDKNIQASAADDISWSAIANGEFKMK